MPDSTVWVIHISKDPISAQRAKTEGFICIGWTKMGDLNQYRTREEMKAGMQRAYPNWSINKINSCYGQTYRFAHEMQDGEIVVYPIKGASEILLGKISGPYRWVSDDRQLVEADYNNIRPVKWLREVPRTAFSQSALHSFGSFSSVTRSTDFLEEVLAVLAGTQAPIVAKAREDTHAALAEEAEEEESSLFDVASQETEDFLLKAWQRTGAAFEEVVAGVLRAIGYTAKVTQASGDHGIDIIAHPDPLGLERPFIKVQVKSGTSTVGEPDVNQLKGLLNHGEQGIVVSLGRFAGGALAVERSSSNLTLIGPKEFVRLFLENYDSLDPVMRARFPLKRVYVPVR